ncbi:LuxR C-terminal-related transcriptional regulator [Streptomyces sp. NPDC060027]|uniref:LuxR C-terminal-related transcriptional regulator n=1 Tax=Streptomyces sp. NPDC060027 TaxID=3347040 RepID=UPI0036A9895D
MSPSGSVEAQPSAWAMRGPENPVARWPLAGRERELEVFARVLASRRSRGLVVAGAAGVGKSRLAEEYLGQAVRAGFRGARATASAAAAAVPLGAIAHLLPSEVDLSDPIAGFAAVAAHTREGRRPWAILIDDLHLLDTASVVLLRQMMDAGLIRLISTIRSGEVTTEAMQTLAQGDAVTRIDLAAFSQGQVGAVLEAALGGPVGPHTVRHLYEASGGNALYLRELVHGSLASGVLASDGETWHLVPGSRLLGTTTRLTELIGNQFAAVGPTARPVLELLALCGPLPLTQVQVVASWQVLADLKHAGLILASQDGRRTCVALADPVYGEVVRAELPVLRRREILLRQAEQVEAYGARRRGDALCIATWRLAATGTAAPAIVLQAATVARNAHDYPQVITLLEALPEPRRTAQTRLMLGDALSQMGKWKQADAVLAEAEDYAADGQEKLAITLARTANLAWSNADPTQALEANSAAWSQEASPTSRRILSGPVYYALDALARLQRIRGRYEDCLATARKSGEICRALGFHNPGISAWRDDAALALHALGKTEEARAMVADELTMARHWNAPGFLGRSLRVSGLVAEDGDRLRFLWESQTILDSSLARLEHAKTLTALGAELRRHGSRTEARPLLRQALDLATQCNATPLMEVARTELAAAGGRPRRDALTGPAALTPSEHRIAELAATGATNRQIAQQLYVTPKTVEVHLSAAYRKLGITTRTQLTSALAPGPSGP